MKILQQNNEYGILLYGSKNYENELIYVIIYGLSKEEYKNKKNAYRYFEECLFHAIRCEEE